MNRSEKLKKIKTWRKLLISHDLKELLDDMHLKLKEFSIKDSENNRFLHLKATYERIQKDHQLGIAVPDDYDKTIANTLSEAGKIIDLLSSNIKKESRQKRPRIVASKKQYRQKLENDLKNTTHPIERYVLKKKIEDDIKRNSI